MKPLWGSSAGACAEAGPGLGGASQGPSPGGWRGGLELGLGRGLILRRWVTGQKKLAEEQTVHRAYWPEILTSGLTPSPPPRLPFPEETSGNPWKVLGSARGGCWRPLAGVPCARPARVAEGALRGLHSFARSRSHQTWGQKGFKDSHCVRARDPGNGKLVSYSKPLHVKQSRVDLLLHILNPSRSLCFTK